VVNRSFRAKVGPGWITPARLFLAACLAASAAPAAAQQPTVPAPAATQPAVPDAIIINKLVWSAMAALDQANQTGNYSVLRDLGAPGFQAAHSTATLGGIFQALKASQLDLGYTLLVAPTYQYPPAFVQDGLLRVRGAFPLRPAAIGFDLLFQNISGRWRIFGIAVAPIVAQPLQSGSTRP
jgi:hypothetical protein